MTDNAEAPAGPDIVVRLIEHVDTWRRDGKIDAISAVADMLIVSGAVEYLRDANARLIAENNTLRAELRAARGEEGR